MDVSVILAHPSVGSFNHAIAGAVVEQLLRDGHRVTFHDLYQEEFDPVLPGSEVASCADVAPEIAAHCREIAAAGGIVIVHPNWWGQPPAILTGWVDRVIRPGVAYNFTEGDSGEGVPVGLLKARAAVVLNTSNTSLERERAVFGDPLESIWRKCVFELCGVSDVNRVMFSVVVTSTPEQREAWLAQTRSVISACFPADPAIDVRTATVSDLPAIRAALVRALDWRAEADSNALDDLIEKTGHSYLLADWGRPGDAAVVAHIDGRAIGAAWYRHWTDASHSYGYVDSTTPEIGIGVDPRSRRRGVGTSLMTRLLSTAAERGVLSVSLSVERDNPAALLYRRLGFRPIAEADNAWTMVKRLPE